MRVFFISLKCTTQNLGHCVNNRCSPPPHHLFLGLRQKIENWHEMNLKKSSKIKVQKIKRNILKTKKMKWIAHWTQRRRGTVPQLIWLKGLSARIVDKNPVVGLCVPFLLSYLWGYCRISHIKNEPQENLLLSSSSSSTVWIQERKRHQCLHVCTLGRGTCKKKNSYVCDN